MSGEKQKAIIFGLGNTFKMYKTLLYCDFDVVGLMSNSARCEKEIDGIPIFGIDRLFDLEYDVICIAANYENSFEIRNQLTNLGIDVSKLRFMGHTGTYPYRIPYDFFRTNLCEKDGKRLFAENVERIVLEINSRCNRKCWYCPNSIVDRFSKNIEMNDALFDKIVCELASIQYRYDISLSYFNDPMCSEKVYERIAQLKKTLPKSCIYLYTNGDMLNKEALENLAKVGCDICRIDIYTNDPPGQYSRNKAFKEADKLLQCLELKADYRTPSPDDDFGYVIARGKIKNMTVDVLTQDFSATACNRAESLPDSLPIPKVKEHHRPCIKNFISFHIAYNGKVYPCPNMHSDVEKHQQYCVGDLNEESIFDVFVGEKLNEFRKNNFFNRDTLPCRSCIWDFEQFVEERYDKPFRDRPGAYT